MKGIFKINSISKAIGLIMFFITFFIFISISTFRISKFEEKLKKQKEKLINNRKEILKNYIEIAYKVVEDNYKKSKSKEEITKQVGNKLKNSVDVLLSSMQTFYENYKNTLSEDELKNKLIDFVKNYRGPNNEYFWINDNTLPYPKMIMHPIKPQLNGTILNNPKFNCAMGKNQNLFQAMVEVCRKEGEGFVDYFWDKPTPTGLKHDVPKISFVKLFKPFNWIIGTGSYIDDIEENIKKETINIIAELRYNNGSGYYWITDNTLPYPKMIMHPIKPQLNGTILNNPKFNCAMGKNQNLFQAMVEVSNEKGSGYVDYVWDKPTPTGILPDQPKLSYVKLFQPWHWVIGTGIYLDDIDNLIAQYKKEGYKDVYFQLFILFLALVFIYLVVYFYIKTRVTKPVNEIKKSVISLSKGKFPKELTVKSNNEIGQITKAINLMIKNLTKVKDFALQVGKGNLDAKFDKLSDEDEFGIALLEMRENLKEAEEKEKQRIQEDKQRQWIAEGLAKFGEILRQNNDDINKLSDEIIRNLVHYVGAVQGGIYLVNDDEPIIELVSAYAYNRKKYLKKEIKFGEGLIGTCAIEKLPIYLTDIPEDYVKITSGLGEANPRNIYIVPLKLEDEVFGIIELASFNIFEKYQLEFINKVSESIASILNSVKINITTQQLLEQSKQQSEELAAQEEELRQNMEEMQATQEEMAKTKRETEKLLRNLDEISNPIITMDTDFNITYINDTGCKIAKVSKADALKMKCYDLWKNPHCHTDKCRCAMAMKTGKSETAKTLIEATGTEIIYTGTPNYDEDGNIIGVIEEIILVEKIKDKVC